MSLPFRLDQADSLVITKEDRLSLSGNAKQIETVVSSFLSLRSKDRHGEKCPVNVSLLCNEPTLSFH